MTRHAIEVACAAARLSSPRETGGILLGWREPAGIRVADVLEIPDAAAGYSHYERNGSLSEDRLTEHLRERNDVRVGYVGEWHTHPRRVEPSALDRTTMFDIAADTTNAVGLLVVVHDDRHSKVHLFGLIVRRGDPTSTLRRPATYTRIDEGEHRARD